MLRTAALLASAGLILAGCTAGADPAPTPSTGSTTSSPTASAATPEPTATGTQAATEQPTPEPSETATVAPSTEPTETREVASPGGLMTATVPAAWESCQDAAARASSIALDVLGAWAADGDCATGTVLVIEAVPVPQGGITAQVYYEQVMVPRAAEDGATLSSERLASAGGFDGIIAVERDASGTAGAQFAIAAGELVVLGTLEGPTVDDATVGRMRDVARTVTVG